MSLKKKKGGEWIACSCCPLSFRLSHSSDSLAQKWLKMAYEWKNRPLLYKTKSWPFWSLCHYCVRWREVRPGGLICYFSFLDFKGLCYDWQAAILTMEHWSDVGLTPCVRPSCFEDPSSTSHQHVSQIWWWWWWWWWWLWWWSQIYFPPPRLTDMMMMMKQIKLYNSADDDH